MPGTPGGQQIQEGRGPAILHKPFKKINLSRGGIVVGEWWGSGGSGLGGSGRGVVRKW
jgi:hypothetical protein